MDPHDTSAAVGSSHKADFGALEAEVTRESTQASKPFGGYDSGYIIYRKPFGA